MNESYDLTPFRFQFDQNGQEHIMTSLSDIIHRLNITVNSSISVSFEFNKVISWSLVYRNIKLINFISFMFHSKFIYTGPDNYVRGISVNEWQSCLFEKKLNDTYRITISYSSNFLNILVKIRPDLTNKIKNSRNRLNKYQIKLKHVYLFKTQKNGPRHRPIRAYQYKYCLKLEKVKIIT